LIVAQGLRGSGYRQSPPYLPSSSPRMTAAVSIRNRPPHTATPRLFSLTWPLLVELLLGMSVGIAGTALAARLSDTSGAAFALSHHVFGTLFMVFRIVGAGVGVVLTQALGAGRRDAADRVARAVLGASTGSAWPWPCCS
jgi:Na+-driven multidrug efflux pump